MRLTLLTHEGVFKDVLQGLLKQGRDAVIVVSTLKTEILLASPDRTVFMHFEFGHANQQIDAPKHVVQQIDLDSLYTMVSEAVKSKQQISLYGNKAIRFRSTFNGQTAVDEAILSLEHRVNVLGVRLKPCAVEDGNLFRVTPSMLTFLNMTFAVAAGLVRVFVDHDEKFSHLKFSIRCPSVAFTQVALDIPLEQAGLLSEISVDKLGKQKVYTEFFAASFRRCYKMFDKRTSIDMMIGADGIFFRFIHKLDEHVNTVFLPNIESWQKETYV
jgi:hypothetical protein